MKGIGASLTVAVAAAGFVWTAHAGENRALLVRGGIARNLVVPHTLAYDRAYRTAPPEQREPWLEDIVTNVLGFGEVKLDLTRVPLEPEDRIVLGNPALSLIEDSTDLVCERDPGVLVPAYQAQARRDRPHLPATMVIADLHCAFSEG